MTCVVTLGEVMLRLKPPGAERLLQSPLLEATFGGAEANVAVALAQLGAETSFVSIIPANSVGDACVAELRRFGVNTSAIRRQGERLGIYYLEQGANRALASHLRPRRFRHGRATLTTSTGMTFSRAPTVHITG